MAWPWSKRETRPSAPQVSPADVGPLATHVLPGESPAELLVSLRAVVRNVNASSGQLPAAGVVAARRLADTLREIIETSTVRPLDVYTLLTVRGALDDYLPTTLRIYLSVSPELRLIPRPNGKTPMTSFLEQLDHLQTATAAVLVAARSQDADALMTQGTFLRTKFSGSDLDLA